MCKFLLVCAVFAVALTACEQQKQASAEVGAIPKQLIDQVSDDINKAQALNAAKLQAAEAATTSTPSENKAD